MMQDHVHYRRIGLLIPKRQILEFAQPDIDPVHVMGLLPGLLQHTR